MKAVFELLFVLALIAPSQGCGGSESETAKTERKAPARESEQPAEVRQLEPYACGSIENLHRLGDILLAGQPSAEDFSKVREEGVKTVINLRRDGEMKDFDEAQTVEDLGMEYVHLPFGRPEELTDEIFDRSRELLRSAEEPILMHCASANRVGALWLAFRVLDQGASYEDALLEAKTVGLKAPALEEKAKLYIERQVSR